MGEIVEEQTERLCGKRRDMTANSDQYISRPNHRILPTAASFGWIHVAAAADPLR